MFSRKKNLLPPKKSMVMNYKFLKQKFREIAQLGLGVIIIIQAVLFYQNLYRGKILLFYLIWFHEIFVISKKKYYI